MITKIINLFQSKQKEDMNFDGAYDSLDNRNYSYEIIAGSINPTELPRSFILDDSLLQNQWYGRYKYWCVGFGTSNAIREMNNALGYDVSWIVKWEVICEEMIHDGLLDVNFGAYAIDGPKTAKKLWWITWFTQVDNVLQIKHSIFNKRPIVTGTNKANWNLTNTYPFILRYLSSSYWHITTIIWYNDDLHGWVFICENSYWDYNGNSWRFYLRYEDINRILFNTKLSLFTDKEDQFNKMKLEIEKAKSLWYHKYSKRILQLIHTDKEKASFMQEALRVSLGMKKDLISNI